MSNDRFSNYGAGKVAGAIEERERIIKLLEGKELFCPCGCGMWLGREQVISLIKGENK